MLEARSLKKAIIPSSLIDFPSPANLQSNRLSLYVNEDGTSCWLYVASGVHVYRILVSLKDSSIDEGKDSLLIPELTQVLDSAIVNRCPHRSEIQTIVLNETENSDCLILGSVDSYGHLIVSRLDSNGKDVERLTFSVSPRDFGVGEAGWAGLSFSPSQWSTTAVAHSFGKSIDVYDQDLHLRTFRTLWYPTAVNFVQNLYSGNESSIVAVTEGCQLSIWDMRLKEKGGCVHRICGSVGDVLYAVCNSSSGNIAVGGADRTMTIYDPRRWAAVSRWVNCSKYEITGISFSSVDPNYAYIQGVDYEVFCGQWKENKKAFSFRGDSNWLGFSKVYLLGSYESTIKLKFLRFNYRLEKMVSPIMIWVNCSKYELDVIEKVMGSSITFKAIAMLERQRALAQGALPFIFNFECRARMC